MPQARARGSALSLEADAVSKSLKYDSACGGNAALISPATVRTYTSSLSRQQTAAGSSGKTDSPQAFCTRRDAEQCLCGAAGAFRCGVRGRERLPQRLILSRL